MLALVLIQIPFVVYYLMPPDPSSVSSAPLTYWGLLVKLAFPDWLPTGHTTVTRRSLRLVLSRFESSFATGTFVGDHPIIVLAAGIALAVSTISMLASLPAVGKLVKLCVQHKRGVSSIALLIVCAVSFGEAVFYLSVPSFAYIKAFISLVVFDLSTCCAFNVVWGPFNTTSMLAFIVPVLYTGAGLCFMQLSREIYRLDGDGAFVLVRWSLFAVGAAAFALNMAWARVCL